MYVVMDLDKKPIAAFASRARRNMLLFGASAKRERVAARVQTVVHFSAFGPKRVAAFLSMGSLGTLVRVLGTNTGELGES